MPEEADPLDLESCLREMEANLRDSLTALRANAFVARLDLPRGGTLGLADMPVYNDEDVADLAAVLLHAESGDATYRIETARETDAATPPVRKAGYAIEDFSLRRRR